MNVNELVARDFAEGETLWYHGIPFRVVNKATLEGPAGNWTFADEADSNTGMGDG